MPKHEAGHDLLGIVVVLGVGKGDAGAVHRDPAAPLDAQHQGAHREDHPQHVPAQQVGWEEEKKVLVRKAESGSTFFNLLNRYGRDLTLKWEKSSVADTDTSLLIRIRKLETQRGNDRIRIAASMLKV